MGFVPTHSSSCRTLSFPITCRDCHHPAFLFSCSCGSIVLFDKLGPPWPIHDCEAAATKAGLGRAKTILEEGGSADAGRSRPFEGLSDLIDVGSLPPGPREEIATLEAEAKKPVTLRPQHNIKQMNPTEDGENSFLIGVLRERVNDAPRVKSLYGVVGDLGLKLLGLPARSRALQVTVIDAGGEPNESYTAVADAGRLEAGAKLGVMVGVSLVGRVGAGYSFWLVQDLQVL